MKCDSVVLAFLVVWWYGVVAVVVPVVLVYGRAATHERGADGGAVQVERVQRAGQRAHLARRVAACAHRLHAQLRAMLCTVPAITHYCSLSTTITSTATICV